MVILTLSVLISHLYFNSEESDRGKVCIQKKKENVCLFQGLEILPLVDTKSMGGMGWLNGLVECIAAGGASIPYALD